MRAKRILILVGVMSLAIPSLRGAETSSVLQHHGSASRAGIYASPALTKTAAAKLRLTGPELTYQGRVYAQPLYWSGGGKELLIVATERNDVIAFDARAGSVVWKRRLADPMPRSALPCGNIDLLGVTGTPIIDSGSRTLYVAAMTTPDRKTARHKIYALSVDDGSVKPGWPVDASGLSSNGAKFESRVQNQRGALALLDGTLYVPYGGHYGDCGDYHGWVIGVPTGDPSAAKAWATPARGAGAWAPAGVVSDGRALYVATGNSFGAQTWSGGNAVVRLQPGPRFSSSEKDFFAPSNWKELDRTDTDLGGTAPVLVRVPGAKPERLVVALGKDGKAYLIDQSDFGGVGRALAARQVSRGAIINAAAVYTTPKGTFVVFRGEGTGCPAGQSGDVTAVKIGASSPPSLSVAWCAKASGRGSPAVSTAEGGGQPIVWVVGAEGDNRLHGFDGETGKTVYAGGGEDDAMGTVRRFQAPMIANGKIYVAGDDRLYSFAPASR